MKDELEEFFWCKPQERPLTHSDLHGAMEYLSRKFLALKRYIDMTNKEAVQAINDIGTQLSKANTEITGKISDLENAINNQDNVSPEVTAALESLKSSSQKLDDIVPDVVPPPPSDGGTTPPVVTDPGVPSVPPPQATQFAASSQSSSDPRVLAKGPSTIHGDALKSSGKAK